MEDPNLKCRACLKQEYDMKSIDFTYNGLKTYAKLIEETLGFKITNEANFSNKICKSCCKILIEFESFKKTFYESTEYFENLLNVKNEIEITDNDVMFIDNNRQETIKVIFVLDNKIEPIRIPNNVEKPEINLNVLKKPVENPSDDQKPKQNNVKKAKKNPDKNHLDSQKYCKTCKTSYKLEEFDFHFENHRKFECEICHRKYTSKKTLADHMNVHLEYCRYICDICGKAFKYSNNLIRHRKLHTNPRESVCDICGTKFNTNQNLKTHYKQKHAKIKDCQCTVCGLAFSLKSTLDKHMKTHDPNRKSEFSCSTCGLSYLSKNNLRWHYVVKHSGFDRKPTCEFCGKKYVNKFDLVKHIKKYHAEENKDNVKKLDECKSALNS